MAAALILGWVLMSTPEPGDADPTLGGEDRGRVGADEIEASGAAEDVNALCLDKRLLLEAYRAATAAFSSRLNLLNSRIGTVEHDRPRPINLVVAREPIQQRPPARCQSRERRPHARQAPNEISNACVTRN
jgi:hypothetical protein